MTLASRSLGFLLSLAVLCADFASKRYVLAHREEFLEGIPLIDGILSFTYVRNAGAAFGMFQGGRWPFVAVSIIAAVALSIGLWRSTSSLTRRSAYALILAGAVGNLIDRLFYEGRVVDFILMSWKGHNFPVYNLADMGVSIGATLLIWSMLREPHHATESADADAPVEAESSVDPWAEVPVEAAGARLDKWLSEHDSELSRNRIQKLILAGLIEVDGRLRPSSHKLRGGESIEWEVPAPEQTSIDPDPTVPFEIVFEDQDLAVILKPAGLVVHPAPGHRRGTLVNGLLARLSSLSAVGGRARPGLVHRLDRDTSGLLLVAKNDMAHQALSDQLRERQMGRVYRALCWGCPDPVEGTIDAPLDRHPQDRKKRAVRPEGRSARTDYRVVEQLAGSASLRLSLHTGRTHQIRVHLAYRGHPVLGDELYGGGASRLKGAAPAHRHGLGRALKCLESRLALHAEELHLRHPRSGQELSFSAPVPAELADAASALAV